MSRRAECGEGPVWDAPANAVHWVDILGGEILITDLATGATTGDPLQRDGRRGLRRDAEAASSRRSRAGSSALDTDGDDHHRVDFLPDGVRMNDAKTDPGGRFWAGSCAMDFADGLGGTLAPR